MGTAGKLKGHDWGVYWLPLSALEIHLVCLLSLSLQESTAQEQRGAHLIALRPLLANFEATSHGTLSPNLRLSFWITHERGVY